MIAELLKRIVFEDVLGLIDTWKVLVLDEITTYMLSQLFKMGDVISDAKIISVEDIKATEHCFDRKISAPVIFFIRPTVDNLVRISTSLSKRNSLCKFAYICFTDPCDEVLRKKLFANPAKKMIASIRCVNCSFLWAGSHSFYVHFPSAFNLYYNPKLHQFQRWRLFKILICFFSQKTSVFPKILADFTTKLSEVKTFGQDHQEISRENRDVALIKI